MTKNILKLFLNGMVLNSDPQREEAENGGKEPTPLCATYTTMAHLYI